MKCKNCEAELNDNMKFCINCGTAINNEKNSYTDNSENKTVGIYSYSQSGQQNKVINGDIFGTKSVNSNEWKTEDFYFPPNITNNSEDMGSKSGDKNKTLKIIIFVLIFVIVALAACFVVWMFMNNSNGNSSAQASSQNASAQIENSSYTSSNNTSNFTSKNSSSYFSFNSGLTSSSSSSSSSQTSSLSSTLSSSKYIFPTDKQYITSSDLDKYTRDEIAIIRNEIYARHGYIFNIEPYVSYFAAKDWYKPNENFDTSMFSEIEFKNNNTISEYEKSKGWR